MESHALRDLCKRYPLPRECSGLEQFSETLEIAGSRVELSGLSVTGPENEPVTGSAATAEGSGPAIARSYFELLERLSVIAAISGGPTEYELRDRAGRPGRRALRNEVFPSSSRPDRWRPSRSNGVAVHDSWQEACDRAAAELVERDRVLRSWYGERPARRCALPEGCVPEGLRSVAEWFAYELAPRSGELGANLTVAVVVGLPRSDTTPLAYGFGANADPRRATSAAATEALQRFGFLYGEAIPQEPPALSPTPDFHQEFFLCPPARELLLGWLKGDLSGERSATGGVADRLEHKADEPCWFVDLTPSHLHGSLFVAKAICPRAEPLVFGEPAPHRAHVERGRRVHPIA